MERVQVQLSPAQLATLRSRSEATGRSIAALVREAVEQWIADGERKRRLERAMRSIGEFHSGRADIAEQHDRFLDEAYGE